VRAARIIADSRRPPPAGLLLDLVLAIPSPYLTPTG